MIQIKNISFSYASDLLYEEASFVVPKNKKVGLVGLNGSGKSTLFNLLLKTEWPDEGKVLVEGKVLLVPQEVNHDPVQSQSSSVREYLHQAKPLNDQHLQEYLNQIELSELSLDDNPNQLSGGQKTKLALLFGLLSEPDILLLDEPTNFLDSRGKKWVMHFLSLYKKTLIVVSHDLDLLDQHIQKVIYINKQTRKFEEFTGNYSQFKRLKAEKDANLMRYIQNQEQIIKRMEKSVTRLRKKTSKKGVHQRVQLEKRLKKIVDKLPTLPVEVVKFKLELPVPAHIGSLPLSLKNVVKSYGDKLVLNDITMSIEKKQRIALIGQNGTGKTTLIKSITGQITPDSGQISLDPLASIGYYSQEFTDFNPNATLYTTLKQNTFTSDNQIRSFLFKFMFQGKMSQKVGSLSGGEKIRLSIAMLMLKDYNFLILDEPTTYLDVLSQRIILDALKLYQGTMLVVSHTKEFLKELKPDKALLMPEGKFVYWDDQLLDRATEI